MKLKPIKTEADHEAALLEIERSGTPRRTLQREIAWIFSSLSLRPTRRRTSDGYAGPIEAIKFRLEQQGEDKKALIGIIGSRTRVHEVLRRDRHYR